MKNFILITVSLLLLFVGCKKYPADDHRSFHTPKWRLLHKWTLKEFVVNGGDSTIKYYKAPYLNDSLKWKLGGSSVEFTKESSGTGDLYHFNIISQSGSLKTDLTWAFMENKNQLSFQPYIKSPIGTPYYFIFFFPSIGGKAGVWDIIKLTNEEMILELTNNAKKKIHVRFQREN